MDSFQSRISLSSAKFTNWTMTPVLDEKWIRDFLIGADYERIEDGDKVYHIWEFSEPPGAKNNPIQSEEEIFQHQSFGSKAATLLSKQKGPKNVNSSVKEMEVDRFLLEWEKEEERETYGDSKRKHVAS